MKKLIAISLLFTGICTWGQDCEKFKTGIFEYLPHGAGILTIERTTTHQTMYFDNNDILIQGSIEWVSPCKYIFTCEKVSGYEMQDLIGEKEYIEITETYENGYTSEITSSDGGVQTVIFTIKEKD